MSDLTQSYQIEPRELRERLILDADEQRKFQALNALEEEKRKAAEAAETARRFLAERRERIATAALTGLLGNGRIDVTGIQFVRLAVSLADILIAELDKETQP